MGLRQCPTGVLWGADPSYLLSSYSPSWVVGVFLPGPVLVVRELKERFIFFFCKQPLRKDHSKLSLSSLTELYFSCFHTVLPKFSVSIQMPQVVTILEENFPLHVCGM